MKPRPGKPDRPIPAKGSWLNPLWQVEMAERNGRRNSQWKCQCKCGKSVTVLRVKIQNGMVKSCGCRHRIQSQKNIKKAIQAYSDQCRQRRKQHAATK